ncbi:branched-chain-amino-acid transaminase [Cohnella faecalis]|uniref:Branched-chain-amino-acid aminotransferase n=2 Tax=Cohnella faecalis TaxID=2315694 RepID=A0A398CEH1_9BACL|nr:branched-chain-amino-acid transaminase [Cohnella faecalis]
MNGELVKRDEAVVSVYDRGFLFGDGVFEGIRAYNGNVFKLKEHLVRLFDSAKAIMLNIPLSHEEIEQAVVKTLKKNQLHTAYIRIIVSRGVGQGYNLDPFVCNRPQLFVMTEGFEAFPRHLYETGIDIVTVATRRNRSDVLSPQVKSLNYLNNILVKIEAIQAGAKDGLIMNTDGYVAEGTTNNIFIVKNGKVVTPAIYQGALEGITRSSIIEILNKFQVAVNESPLTRHDIHTADEVFLTGTASEVIPVVKVDGRVVADGKPGEKTRLLIDAFQQLAVTDGVKFSL